MARKLGLTKEQKAEKKKIEELKKTGLSPQKGAGLVPQEILDKLNEK